MYWMIFLIQIKTTITVFIIQKKMSFKIILLVVLIVQLVQLQEVVQQELGEGQYTQSFKQARLVPRYYICGINVARRVQYRQPPQVCQQKCKRSGWRRKKTCWTECQTPAIVLEWIRINGMAMRYCHFQNWSNQFEMSSHGDWGWLGYKMCSNGQFVNGFSVKKNGRDGISGLRINCKGMYNSNDNSHAVVFDGEGNWQEIQVKSTFGLSYRVKRYNDYITGLSMEFTDPPFITIFNFQYIIPKNFNSAPQLVDRVVINNNANSTMKKTIQFTRSKEYTRIWQNEKGQLHGQKIAQTMSKSYKQKASLKIPFLSPSLTSQTKQQISMARYEESMEKFTFGTVEHFKVGSKYKDEVEVPGCRKYTINQIVYHGEVDIPYIVNIEYTNGVATERQVINGVYRGTVVGDIQTNINAQNIC